MLPLHVKLPGMQVSRLGSGWKRRSQRNESANRGKKMSLRRIAKELGISPAYLSYMLNGKRPRRKDLYQRYMGVVNTFVNSDVVGVETQLDLGEGISPSQEEKSMERAMGFEPTTSCLGSKHSTPELRPLSVRDCNIFEPRYPRIRGRVAKPPLMGNGFALSRIFRNYPLFKMVSNSRLSSHSETMTGRCQLYSTIVVIIGKDE